MQLNPHKELLEKPIHQMSEFESRLWHWEYEITEIAKRFKNKLPLARTHWFHPLVTLYSSWGNLRFLIEDYYRLRITAHDKQSKDHDWAVSILEQYEGCIADMNEIEKALGDDFIRLLQQEIEETLKHWNVLMDSCVEQGGFDEDADPTDDIAMKMTRDDLYWIWSGLQIAKHHNPKRFKDININSIRERTRERDAEFCKFLKGERDNEYEGEVNMWWHNPGEGPDV